MLGSAGCNIPNQYRLRESDKGKIPILIAITCVACGHSPSPTGSQTSTTDLAILTNSPDPNSRTKQKLPAEKAWYSIYKFVDGDTFWLDDSTATGTKIRLIGMDTPETKNVFKKRSISWVSRWRNTLGRHARPCVAYYPTLQV